MKYLGIAVIALATLQLVACGKAKDGAATTDSTASSTTAAATPAAPASSWKYDSSKDEITGKFSPVAELTTNEASEKKASLLLLGDSDQFNWFVSVTSKETPFQSSDEGVPLAITFDNGTAQVFKGKQPKGTFFGTSESLTIHPAWKFIMGAKQSKTVRITANFPNGPKNVEFSTAGLKWPDAK